MARAPLLQLSGISLTFGGNPVFDNLDLVVQPGDRVALVGRNGSGKSTLMKVMAGLVDADAGLRVVLLDQDAQAAARGCERGEAHYAERVAGGKVAAATADERRARLVASADWSALAPADRRLYAIRDVTATVESVPLIPAGTSGTPASSASSRPATGATTGTAPYLRPGRVASPSLAPAVTGSFAPPSVAAPRTCAAYARTHAAHRLHT